MVFAAYPDIETCSAGTARDAEEPLSADLIEWADFIFVMERVHRSRIRRDFATYLNNKPIIALGISDKYRFMDDELIRILKDKMHRWTSQA